MTATKIHNALATPVRSRATVEADMAVVVLASFTAINTPSGLLPVLRNLRRNPHQSPPNLHQQWSK